MTTSKYQIAINKALCIKTHVELFNLPEIQGIQISKKKTRLKTNKFFASFKM